MRWAVIPFPQGGVNPPPSGRRYIGGVLSPSGRLDALGGNSIPPGRRKSGRRQSAAGRPPVYRRRSFPLRAARCGNAGQASSAAASNLSPPARAAQCAGRSNPFPHSPGRRSFRQCGRSIRYIVNRLMPCQYRYKNSVHGLGAFLSRKYIYMLTRDRQGPAAVLSPQPSTG